MYTEVILEAAKGRAERAWRTERAKAERLTEFHSEMASVVRREMRLERQRQSRTGQSDRRALQCRALGID